MIKQKDKYQKDLEKYAASISDCFEIKYSDYTWKMLSDSKHLLKIFHQNIPHVYLPQWILKINIVNHTTGIVVQPPIPFQFPIIHNLRAGQLRNSVTFKQTLGDYVCQRTLSVGHLEISSNGTGPGFNM